jgi:hypothetical protein
MTNFKTEIEEIGEITFETAWELGLLIDDSLDVAYKSVEGSSILSGATDRVMERVYRARMAKIRADNQFVYFRGKKLKVI